MKPKPHYNSIKLRLRCSPNKHQKEFYEDLESRLLHLSTGFGGGKTYILVFKLLQLSYINRPHRGGIVVPDFLAGWTDELLRARGRRQLGGFDLIEVPPLVCINRQTFPADCRPFRRFEHRIGILFRMFLLLVRYVVAFA